MIFRTSWKERQPGFKGIVVCFDPGTENEQECTDSSGSRRKKRDQETFVSVYSMYIPGREKKGEIVDDH